MMGMPSGKTGAVRSVRRPRHGWFDYEVFDVFGDQLGPYGIAVYMVLARHCYGGFRVTMGLREMAGHARMSKTEVARTLEKMIQVGLVVEHKGPTPKSVSSYDLTDVKDLVDEMRTVVKERTAGITSVPVGDRRFERPATRPQEGLAGFSLTNHHDSRGDAPTGTQSATVGAEELETPEVSPRVDNNCPPQGQMPTADTNDTKTQASVPLEGTDLSQKRPLLGTDLSQPTARVIDRQETRNKKQEGGAAQPPRESRPSGPPSQPHAERLMDLLGIAATRSDLDVVRQVIAYEARAARTDPEEACLFLLGAAQAAIKRGETVNVFWFKDRKFANGGGNDGRPGKDEPSPTRTRVERNRVALEKALAKRGVVAPWLADHADAEPLPEPGSGGRDGGVSRGLRTAGAEILPPESAGGSGGAED